MESSLIEGSICWTFMSRGSVTCLPVWAHTSWFDPCNTKFVAKFVLATCHARFNSLNCEALISGKMLQGRHDHFTWLCVDILYSCEGMNNIIQPKFFLSVDALGNKNVFKKYPPDIFVCAKIGNFPFHLYPFTSSVKCSWVFRARFCRV